MKTFKPIAAAVLVAVSALCTLHSALGQVAATYSSNCITGPITLQTTSSNLLSGQYFTPRLWQGRHFGIGVQYFGNSTTNTGTIGFLFGVQVHGAGGPITTTKPFVFTSTANGTNPVVDWGVFPSYTLGPADCLVLLGVTNAAVNVNPLAAGSITLSNVWLQTDTRP
jgi:hypothetical protein